MTFKSKIRVWRKLSLLHKRQKVVGSYAFSHEQQIVEVRLFDGRRRVRILAGSKPEAVAKRTLLELAEEPAQSFDSGEP
jgi:hypothetical protein